MKKKVIGMIVILFMTMMAVVWFMNRNNVVEVEIAAVKKDSIAEYIEELGVVMTEKKSNIFAPAAGKVTEVMVKVGDLVEAGDILVRMDGQQLSRQMMELEAQKSALMAQYKEVMEPVDGREIQKLELQITTQERRVQEAERKRDNHKTLYEAGAISYEDYHATVTALEVEEKQLDALLLDLEVLKKPVSENVISQYEAQLRQLDIQMEDLRSKEQDMVITSPIKGTVMIKEVEVGQYLQPGLHIMEIGDKDTLYVESDVLVGDIGNVKIGGSVEISHKDLDIEGMKGRVRKIHPQAFSKVSDLGIEQKRVKVEIDLEDTNEEIRPGYNLDLKIIIQRKEDALLIPESAVFQIKGKDHVFVNENNIARLREIKKGIESKREVEVIAGLEEGEEVILSPNEALEEGKTIKPR